MKRTRVGFAVAGSVVVAAAGIGGCGLVLDLGGFHGTADGGIATGVPDARAEDVRTGNSDSRVRDSGAGMTDSGRRDAGTGFVDAAVGALGAACTTPGALSCNGHDSRESLICASSGAGLVWEGNGQCQSETRCDTAAGPDLGTCQPIVPVCEDAGPGQRVCTTITECDAGTGSGTSGCTTYPEAVRCGPDLVTTTPIETCVEQACTAGACTGSCDPQSTQCSGKELQTCSATATWGNATPCPGALVDGGSPDASPTKQCCGVGCIDTASDPHNCGGCGKQCGGTCVAGLCNILLSSDDKAGPVAIDSTNAYWIDISGAPPSLWKVALTGGTPVPLYTPTTTDGGTSGYPTLGSIAIDATHVYWTEQAGAAVVKQMPLTGGTATILATDTSKIYALAVDSSSVYWGDSSAAILKAPLTPGATTPLASGQTLPGSSEGSAQQIALDSASHLYWLNVTLDGIVRVAVTGGGTTTVSTDPTSGDTVNSIAASGERVFWTVATEAVAGGNLVTYNGATGIVSTLATSLNIGYDYPGVATNSTTVTWIGRDGFMSMLQTGGAITPLTPSRPNFIAMNASVGVWVDYAGVHVVELP